MNIRKLKLVFNNPEIIGFLLTQKKRQQIRHHLSIKRNRQRMLQICDYVDSLLSKNYDVDKIIEMTSTQFNFIKYPIAWYALIRKYKPSIILETGVSMGWSSFMILTALQREMKGVLYSIDMGGFESIDHDGGVGYMVPDNLKQHWHLIIADSKKALLPLLEKLGKIDMFVHDSEHSYEMMMFEYNNAWNYLGQQGILCSDDINHSAAFNEFVNLHDSEIDTVHVFTEISRPSDAQNLRPQFGYLLKRTT
jgi:predicted O-methyltransferase YrrM